MRYARGCGAIGLRISQRSGDDGGECNPVAFHGRLLWEVYGDVIRTEVDGD